MVTLNLGSPLWPAPKWDSHPHCLPGLWGPGYPRETSAPLGQCPWASTQARCMPEAVQTQKVPDSRSAPLAFRAPNSPLNSVTAPGEPRGRPLGFWHPPEQLPRQKVFVFPGWTGESSSPPQYLFPAKDLGRTPDPLSFPGTDGFQLPASWPGKIPRSSAGPRISET